jgi:hypothetical protein
MNGNSAPARERETEIQPGNSPETVKWPSIISYNLTEEERPGGLKVRFKVKIQTGRKARETDARQAAAIRELLIWARKQPHPMP